MNNNLWLSRDKNDVYWLWQDKPVLAGNGLWVGNKGMCLNWKPECIEIKKMECTKVELIDSRLWTKT